MATRWHVGLRIVAVAGALSLAGAAVPEPPGRPIDLTVRAAAPGDAGTVDGPGTVPTEGSDRADDRADGPDGSPPDAEPGAAATATTVGDDTGTAPPARTLTLVATGDVLLHPPLWEQAAADAATAGRAGHDFAPLLADIAPVVREADLAVCHLETPLAPVGGPYAGYPSFSVPPEIAPALAATGYDACTTASNHTYDRGADGVDRTLAALDAAGLAHHGSARTPAEAAAPTVVTAGDGVRVGLLSYTFGFNGVPAPNGETWRSNPIDEPRVLSDAAAARGAGADVVVVALHWGDEYVHEPNTQQRELGPALVASPDVDLVLGHHAHVVQPLEAVGGEWVVYGLGNLVAAHSDRESARYEGLLVQVTFVETAAGWRTDAAEYAPLVTDARGPIRVVDVDAALADPAADPALRPRLVAARDRTAAVVGARGAVTAGLVPLHRDP